MLILQRRADQGIKIGDDIEIVILAVNGDQVKVGIQAPRSVRVLRSELAQAVQEENRRAAEAAVTAPGDAASFGDALRQAIPKLASSPLQ